MKPDDAGKLRRRLLGSDVPSDVAQLVADLLDHTTQLEQAIDLIRNGLESALRHAPAYAIHLQGPRSTPGPIARATITLPRKK